MKNQTNNTVYESIKESLKHVGIGVLPIIIWVFTAMSLFFLAGNIENSSNYLSVINLLVLFGFTFSIGLFTYHPIVRDEKDTTHQRKILLYGLIAFMCTIIFALSLFGIHSNDVTFKSGTDAWIIQLRDLFHTIASLTLVLSIAGFFSALLATIIEFAQKTKNMYFG
ncbi:MAG: hypothetical protein V1777_00285 [Candidatus Micrarchaeota archaeon]